MKRTFRAVVVAALTAAVALGVTAPAATAAPKGKSAHVKTVKTKATKAHVKVDRAAHKLAIAQRQVVRDIERKDAGLVRAARDHRLAALAVEVADAIRTNVAADRAELTALKAAVLAADATVDLRQVRADLRDVRPEVYVLVVNVAREVAQTQSEVDANGALLAEAALAGSDVTAAQADNDVAGVLAASALETVLGAGATDGKALVHEARADLAAAGVLLEAVAAFLAAPVEEAPVEEAPVEEVPVEEVPVS